MTTKQSPWFCALVLAACAPSPPGDDDAAVAPDARPATPPDDCLEGTCVDTCAAAEATRSYIGCEYWPVDLQNNVDVFANPAGDPCSGTRVPLDADVCYDPKDDRALGLCGYGGDCGWTERPGVVCGSAPACAWDAQRMPFTIVVGNPDASRVATVTLSNAAGATWSSEVGPGETLAIEPQQLGFADQSLLHSGIEAKAYRLIASRPVVAYQFNPLDNAFQFSNEGSLLIPAHTYGKNYAALSYPTIVRAPDSHNPEGFVAVVASMPGETRVTVEPRGRVNAGRDVPAFGPGDSVTFTLRQYDVLNLKAHGAPGGGPGDDLTGSRITGDRPFGVFAGHDGANLGAQCCLDHLEEQMFPVTAWGRHYAVARAKPRPSDQPDRLRILAVRDGTDISVEPLGGTPCPTLAAGEFCTVSLPRDVELTATQPILIGHYLASSGGNQPGDPSLSLPAPIEQFRTEYMFLIPNGYNDNYVSVIAPSESPVAMDGDDVTGELQPFGSLQYAAGRLPVGEGPHRIDCAMGCGIEVYGYGEDVSYMFAGGLDLEEIVIP